jgi:hypothetical protein
VAVLPRKGERLEARASGQRGPVPTGLSGSGLGSFQQVFRSTEASGRRKRYRYSKYGTMISD